MLNRILAEGHLLGNHTFEHPLDRVPSLLGYYRDVLECQKVLQSTTGHRPDLFRPPLGTISVGSLVAPRLAGLRTLLWSIDVDDWKLRRSQDSVQAGRRLAETVRPGDVVLLHDDNPCTITLLETALPRLRERQLKLK
jgi:peptidoglycan/xylan/chitin deacetylase (PgdA/CDA1 family)